MSEKKTDKRAADTEKRAEREPAPPKPRRRPPRKRPEDLRAKG
jgi:hypothetical protein